MAEKRKTYRKIITSPELTEQINPDNIQLMERFLRNFATKHSPKSVINYRSNLTMFFTWNLLHNDNIFFIDIKKYHLMDFFDYAVMELHWNSNRFAQCHSTLSSFSTWIENMYDEQYPLFHNLLPKIEKPVKNTVRKKSVFQKEELDDLLNWLGEQHRFQEQCLLALMMASGARISELCRFTISMIDETNTAFNDLFLETTEEMQVKGRGVNGKSILRYIIKDLFLPYYYQWLPVREQILKDKNINHDYIFIKQDGEPAQVSTLNGWLEKWDEILDKHLYAHSLRHFWCSYLLKIGLEKELVQEMQQWSSDTLVDLYNDNSAKDRTWKGLDKLKNALENDNAIVKSQNVLNNHPSESHNSNQENLDLQDSQKEVLANG